MHTFTVKNRALMKNRATSIIWKNVQSKQLNKVIYWPIGKTCPIWSPCRTSTRKDLQGILLNPRCFWWRANAPEFPALILSNAAALSPRAVRFCQPLVKWSRAIQNRLQNPIAHFFTNICQTCNCSINRFYVNWGITQYLYVMAHVCMYIHMYIRRGVSSASTCHRTKRSHTCVYLRMGVCAQRRPQIGSCGRVIK
jgi:hypothetical protein